MALFFRLPFQIRSRAKPLRSPRKLLWTGLALLLVLGLAACDEDADDLASLELSPASATMNIGDTQQFTAQGTFTDGTVEDFSSAVFWSVDRSEVATISDTGLVTAQGPGSALITATDAFTGVFATATITVLQPVLQAVSVTPVNPSLAEGNTLQFTATGTFSDGGSRDMTGLVDWVSSDPGVAPVDATGLVFGAAAGTATIAATPFGSSLSGSTTLTVVGSSVVPLPPDTFAVTVDGVPAGYEETEDATVPEGYDPLIRTAFDQTDGDTRLALMIGYDQLNGFFGTLLQIAYPGAGTGTFTHSGDNADVLYETPAQGFGHDFMSPINTSATITVDSYGNVGEQVTGTFAATLCDFNVVFTESVGNECANAADQVLLTAGAFSATRVPNIGTAANSKEIEADTGFPEAHQLDTTVGPVNHYVVFNVTPGTPYAIDLTNQIDDVDLRVYDGDDSFTATAVCDVADNTVVAPGFPEQCIITATGPNLYFTVSYAGALAPTTATYDVEVTTFVLALVSIAVEPNPVNMEVGSVRPFLAIGTFNDTSTLDMTGTVNWFSSDTGVANVAPGGLVTAGGAPGAAVIFATDPGSGISSADSGQSATLNVVAQVIFNLRDTNPIYVQGAIESFDEVNSFPLTLSGVTATLTANDGVLNQTASGFGIDAAAAGDTTNELDDGSGVVEAVNISFNTRVLFRNVVVSAFVGGDQGTVLLPGGPVTIAVTGPNPTGDVIVPVGTSVTVEYVGGSGTGFSFDGFTVLPWP